MSRKASVVVQDYLVHHRSQDGILDDVVPAAEEDEEVDDGGEGLALDEAVRRLEDDLLHQVHVTVEHLAQVEDVVGRRVAFGCLQKNVLKQKLRTNKFKTFSCFRVRNPGTK